VSIDADRMAGLRRRFIEAAAVRADEIAILLRQGDLDAVRAIAHGLAGRSGMFGFVELGMAALRVDEAETSDVPMRANELMDHLRRAAQAD
jgi:HPt (histidine-containing phosphotransfer) domain-containing protein